LTEASSVRSFLFGGLAVEGRLRDFEREGVPVLAETDPGALQRVLPIESFSPAVRRSAMRTLPAFLAFFCLENAVRELITERLIERHGSEWWTVAASEPVRKKVTKRQESEEADRWHMQRGAHEVFYTDFGDLLTIIKNNWAEFSDLFPDQNWITSRLSELEKSRNIIAHSNVLDDREVDRIRMYLEDWIRQVG
jgi:hypothetical protein